MTEPRMTEPRMISVTEAAEVSGYSAGHIRWLVQNEKIAYRRVGKRFLLIDRKSLLDYTTEMDQLGTAKFNRKAY